MIHTIFKVLGVSALLVSIAVPIGAQPLEVGPYRLSLAKGFEVLPSGEDGTVQIRTPARHPVSVVPLTLGSSLHWESVALEYLLTEYRRVDAKILPGDHPEEVSIKREGGWTTLYWTYGGTRSYFGMYWGGRTEQEGALLFWASPLQASGRPQYQALTEVTKGVTIAKS